MGHPMGGVRPVVVAAVVVLLAGALALVFVQRMDDGEPWESAAISDTAFAADRKSILVLASDYRSGSCTEPRVRADQDGTEWTVTLEIRRVGEWCTLEGCLGYGSTIAEIEQQGDLRVGACPPVFSLELDEPAPADVTLVAGR